MIAQAKAILKIETLLKLQYFGHLMRRADSLEKTLMLGKTEGRRRRGRGRMRWLDGITDSVDMVCINSGREWRTGKSGMLRSMGSQSVRHNWATEQQQTHKSTGGFSNQITSFPKGRNQIWRCKALCTEVHIQQQSWDNPFLNHSLFLYIVRLWWEGMHLTGAYWGVLGRLWGRKVFVVCIPHLSYQQRLKADGRPLR